MLAPTTFLELTAAELRSEFANYCGLNRSKRIAPLVRSALRRQPLLDPRPDKPPRPVHKTELVRQATFQQDSDARVARNICRRYQRHILSHAEMGKANSLGQNEKTPRFRRLDLTQFPPEILNEGVVEGTGHFHGLLADQLEAFIQRVQSIACDEDTCSQGFCYFGILGNFAQFLKDFVGTLSALAQIAEHQDEEFFWVFHGHYCFSLSILFLVGAQSSKSSPGPLLLKRAAKPFDPACILDEDPREMVGEFRRIKGEMGKSRHGGAQLIAALKQVEAGRADDVARECGQGGNRPSPRPAGGGGAPTAGRADEVERFWNVGKTAIGLLNLYRGPSMPDPEVKLPFEFGKPLRWARRTFANSNVGWRYGFAVTAVFAAAGIRLAFEPIIGIGIYTPYLPFAVAAMIASLFGGRGPGLAATLLSACIVDWLFLGPLSSLDPRAIRGLGVFVVLVAALALLVGSFRESLQARARVEEDLRRYSQVIDLSHDAVITMDLQRRILTWNKGAEEMYGWSKEDAVGKLLPQLLESVAPISLTEVDRILGRERRWEGELSQIARNGRRLDVDCRKVLFGGGNGLPPCILEIGRDITARKKMEEDLRESEGQFRTLANAIPQLCGIANPDGRFFWSNQRWCDYTGLTPEQSEGWGWVSALDLEASSGAVERWRNSIAAGGPFESAFAVRGADGVVHPFLGMARPVRDHDGKVVRWFGTMTDITEQRRTEDALRKAHAEERARAIELQAIMDAMPIAMFIARDPECRNVIANRTAYEFLGLPPGMNPVDLAAWGDKQSGFRVMKDGREILLKERPLLKAAASGQAAHDVELEVLFEDGRRRDIVGNAVPFLDAEGHSRGAVGIFVDVTERKQAEERLRRAQKLESIGLLAGGVAHDFNNLLTVIIGNADSVLRRYPSIEEIQHIMSASERAAQLTRQLLAYAGKGQFVARTFDLSDLVSNSAQLLSTSIPQGVELMSHLSEEELPLKADPSQIEQILVNLVINAGEAIPPETSGRIEIATSACEVALETVREHAPEFDVRPGRFVCLEVTDNGSGMDEATLTRIFDPFFSTKFTGRGLGLAAVQGIVRSLRGFIEVHSSRSIGSTVRVFLPAEKSTEEVPAISHLGLGASRR
jgi:two-component system cell cycle sensor histidine kinase/response regulator CckA